MTDAVVDHGWAWVTAFAGHVIMAILIGIKSTTGVIVIAATEVFAASSLKLTLILSTTSIVYAAIGECLCLYLRWLPDMCLFTTGVLNDKVHARVQVMTGGVCMFVGFSACFFAMNVDHLFVYSVFYGLSLSLVWCQTIVAVSQYFEKHKTLAVGIVTSGGSIGATVFPFFLVYLLEQYSFRGTFLIVGALSLNIVLFGSLLRPAEFYHLRALAADVSVPKPFESSTAHTLSREDSEESLDETDDKNHEVTCDAAIRPTTIRGIDVEQSDESAKRASSKHLVNSESTCMTETRYNAFWRTSRVIKKAKFIDISLLKNPVFVSCQIGAALILTGRAYIATFLAPFDKQIISDLNDVAILLAIFGACELITRFPWGLLGDSKKFDRFKLMIFSCLLIGVFLIAARWFTQFWMLVVLHVVVSVGCSGISVLYPVILIDLFGAVIQARSFGISLVMSNALSVALYPLVGYLRDVTGDYAAPLNFIAALYLTSCAIFILVTYPMSRRNLDAVPSELGE